jgi:hypothetical protein
MLIDSIDSIKFTVSSDDTNIEITVTDSLDVVLGKFRIKQSRADNFLDTLRSIVRENYSAFEAYEKASTKVSNKTSGTINF